MTPPTPAPAPEPLTDDDLAKLRAYAEPWAETDVDSHIADMTLRLLAEYATERAAREQAEHRADMAEIGIANVQSALTAAGVPEAMATWDRVRWLAETAPDAAAACDVCRGVGGQHRMSCYEHNRRDMRSTLRRERDEARTALRQAQTRTTRMGAVVRAARAFLSTGEPDDVEARRAFWKLREALNEHDDAAAAEVSRG